MTFSDLNSSEMQWSDRIRIRHPEEHSLLWVDRTQDPPVSEPKTLTCPSLPNFWIFIQTLAGWLEKDIYLAAVQLCTVCPSLTYHWAKYSSIIVWPILFTEQGLVRTSLVYHIPMIPCLNYSQAPMYIYVYTLHMWGSTLIKILLKIFIHT